MSILLNNKNESADQEEVTIGVLALQGAFEEHQDRLERLRGVNTVLVSYVLSMLK